MYQFLIVIPTYIILHVRSNLPFEYTVLHVMISLMKIHLIYEDKISCIKKHESRHEITVTDEQDDFPLSRKVGCRCIERRWYRTAKGNAKVMEMEAANCRQWVALIEKGETMERLRECDMFFRRTIRIY